MWENLKKKLPMKATYTENGISRMVTIVDMKITNKLISFKLDNDKHFNIGCNRKYLSMSVQNGKLTISAPYCWTLMLAD